MNWDAHTDTLDGKTFVRCWTCLIGPLTVILYPTGMVTTEPPLLYEHKLKHRELPAMEREVLDLLRWWGRQLLLGLSETPS